MQTKNFTLLLLTAVTSFMLSCSKHESMMNTSAENLQTGARAAKSFKDSLLGTWYLRRVDCITIDAGKRKLDTVTKSYEKGKYIVKYYENGTGMEMFEDSSGSYIYYPFTFVETGLHHIRMTEGYPGSRIFNFGVYFPKRKLVGFRLEPQQAILTQMTGSGDERVKTVWYMEKERAMTVHNGRPES